MYKLIIQDDEGKTTVVPLIRDEITIGRKEGNTIRLTERNVSRRHARILKQNGHIYVEDFDSYNGIRVNGSRIQGRVAVNEADRIQIGDYLLELKLERAQQPVGHGGDPFGDVRTAPIERPDPSMPPQMAGASGAGIPQARPNEPTVPYPASPAAMGLMAAVGAPAASLPPQAPAVAAMAPAAAPSAATPARLFVVSSNFAGREYVLDKPALVIGRTKDNDIVIDHRSISRHHAKIVHEGGHYNIVDLQSSNGVRVNGEDYGKVELRKGDLIDLGHVRMRFVEPGEDFVFARDAQIVDAGEGPGGGGKGKWIAIAGVLVVGGAVAIFLSMGGKKKKTGGDDPGALASNSPSVSASPSASGSPSTSPAASPSATADPTPGPGGRAQPNIDQAKQAMTDEKWSDAMGFAVQALAAEPGNAEATEIKQRAESELRAQVTYENLKKKAKVKDAEAVLEAYNDLDAASVYREKAKDDYNAARQAFLGATGKQIDKFNKGHKCSESMSVAERAGQLVPDDLAELTSAAKQCKAEVASVDKTPSPSPSRSASPSPSPSPSKTASPSPSPSTPAGGGGADALVAEARDALRKGQWAAAYRKADQALGESPGNVDALSLAAMASCKLGKVDKATSYLGKIKGQRQMMVRQFCGNAGVTLP